jgi:hypothetical protein
MQTWIIKAIVKLYFIGALAVSFNHIVTAAHKLQLLGWQSFTTPFAIDGIAVIGMVMRSERWSDETNRTGFRVQMGAGALSLVCNVFAGNTLGERIYGVLIVALFIFSEWLSDRLVTRAAATKAAEIAELEALAAQPTAEEIAAQQRSERARKAAATRKANKARKDRERKAQAKALEALVAGQA